MVPNVHPLLTFSLCITSTPVSCNACTGEFLAVAQRVQSTREATIQKKNADTRQSDTSVWQKLLHLITAFDRDTSKPRKIDSSHPR